MLSSDLRLALGAGLCVASVLAVLLLLVVHVRRNRRRPVDAKHNIGRHVLVWWPHHALALAAATFGSLLLAGVVGGVAYVALRHGGAIWPDHRPQPPDYRYVRAGAGGPPDSTDLSAYMRGRVYDQGQSSACGNHALIEAIMITLRTQGYVVPDLSPWQNAYYGEYNSAAGSSIDQDVAAVNAHGVETLAGWPTRGGPDATDGAHTFPLHVSYDTLFNAGQGDAGLAAVKGALDQGRVVVLLHRTYEGEYSAYGQWQTDNGGGFHFGHFFTAVQHQGDLIRSLNSWGNSYGQAGVIGFTPAAFYNTIDAAYILHISGVPAAWLPPTPPPPTVRPTSTPAPPRTATPRPTRRPTATPTARPRVQVPCAQRRLVARLGASLHALPRVGSRPTAGVVRLEVLHTVCPAGQTAHWIKVRDGRGRVGWLRKSVL